MRDTFVRALIEIAKQDKDVLLVTGDLGFGVLKPYWEQLPNQFINIGIDEQNMTGFAAGLSLEGKTVFTYSIGNFPTLRCLEQIRNDCAYHNANVKIVCVGGGFSYGALGMSHHATEDLSIMRALPNVSVFAPADPIEAELITNEIYTYPGTCYLRLGRGGEQITNTKLRRLQIGKANKICDGTDVAIFTTGSILDEVIVAKECLKRNGISPSVYSFPTVKPIDEELIIDCAKKNILLVSVEENNIVGGFGSAISEILTNVDVVPIKLVKIGIHDRYTNVVGDQNYLREYNNLNASKITEIIITELNRYLLINKGLTMKIANSMEIQ